MGGTPAKIEGPDFARGVAWDELADGAVLTGHVADTPALLLRRHDEFFIIGSSCTHYGAPLCEGLVVGDAIRCPWHHAEFNIRDGEVIRAPALDRLPCWQVYVRDGRVFAGEPVAPSRFLQSTAPEVPTHPSSVVIIGGGAAGYFAAATLRQEGYSGCITLLSADASLPCDRPNLSKGYLAGTAPEDWLLLRPAEFYQQHHIEVRLNARVLRVDPEVRRVELQDGSTYSFDALLIATGAEPVKLQVPGADLPHVHYLRTLADSRRLLANAQRAKSAVVVGASFIGLEVAAALRTRGLKVDVIGRETIPMAKVLGPDVGSFIRHSHESNGIQFHLGREPRSIDDQTVTLDSGERLDADLVVVGVGVRPAIGLAEEAGLEVGDGVIVDEYLETSVPGIFAAGDIAAWPDPLTGQRLRIEHFVVAERQGQTAARNILGYREPFQAVPFFWTEQFDLSLAYVGHAKNWDAAIIDGDLEARECAISYRLAGRKLAVALIGQDVEGLRAELEFERQALEMTKPVRCGDDPEPYAA